MENTHILVFFPFMLESLLEVGLLSLELRAASCNTEVASYVCHSQVSFRPSLIMRGKMVLTLTLIPANECMEPCLL